MDVTGALQKLKDCTKAADLDARNKKNKRQLQKVRKANRKANKAAAKAAAGRRASWDKVWNSKKQVWEWTAYQWMVWWKSTGWVLNEDDTWTPPPDSDGWWRGWNGWHHSGDGKGKGKGSDGAAAGKGEGGWAKAAANPKSTSTPKQSCKRSEPPSCSGEEVGIP